MKKTCSIIGSGIAGIAAAIRLAIKGFKVTVFEANDRPGGKIAELKASGYRFDMGPSVFTMPEYVDELFTISRKNPRDYFKYTRLDPVFKYFFDDGTVINAYHGKEKFAEEIASKTKDSKESVIEFLKQSEIKFKITDPVFLQRSLHQPLNYFNSSTLYGLLNFRKIHAFQTMNEFNRSFFRDKKTVEIFNRYASYNGSDPYQAPATLNIITHYEINLGAYLPKGGMFAIVQALVKLAEESGVVFRMNSPVQEIVLEGKQAKAIKTQNEILPFDIIVSNSDIDYTYKKLMVGMAKPRLILSQPKSSSVIVFYWGMKKTFPELGVHNMLLSNDSEKEYRQIFKNGNIYNDPTVYLYISSKANPQDAPAGCENWFTMITVPNNQGQDWDNIISETRKNTIKKINTILGEDIEPIIEFENILEPRLIQQRTSSAFGAVYGNSSNSKFAAFLRHPNFSRKIKNLYFCGGSVHPGAGIPLCLLSAKITSELIG